MNMIELSKDNYCKNYSNWCEKEKRTCNNCYYERGYNMTDEEKEIFKNLKEYMQNEIDNGYNKFIYNDLNWDFKCIDCINAIDTAINLIEKQSKEIEELKKEKAKRQWVHIKENGEVEPLFYVSKDKIKSKIKELDEKLFEKNKILDNLEIYYKKEVLQSLLNEEE